jgi:nitroreductase
MAGTEGGRHKVTKMSSLNRRLFLRSSAAVVALSGGASLAQSPGATEGEQGATLRQALELRKSTRTFTEQHVSRDMLLDMLALVHGVNRPASDGRTVPSWHGARDVAVYVATAEGTLLHDPHQGSIEQVSAVDMRARCSPQPFVGTAPTVLIFVSDEEKLAAAAGPASADSSTAQAAMDLRVAGFVDTAVIAQNVYLYCAANGLGTCLVGGINADVITADLGLATTQIPTYVQPIGYPA